MGNVTVLYSFAKHDATTRLGGLTDDCVVVSVPGKNKKNKIVFVPKNGGPAVDLDPFPTSNLFPAGAHGDYAVIQQAAPRKPQTTFLLSKNGDMVQFESGGTSKSRNNVFAARIDSSGVYGEIRKANEVSYAQWDFAGKLVISSSINYIAGTLNNVPVLKNLLVDLPSNLGESAALFVQNDWVVGRAFEKDESGVARTTTSNSVSWIWNMSSGLKLCSMPDGRKLSVTTVSPNGRFVVGLAWDNKTSAQESVLVDLVSSTFKNLESVAECTEGGMADWSGARFDTDGSLYLRRIKVLNGPMEVVKVSGIN